MEAATINPLDHERLVCHLARKLGARSPIRQSEQYSAGWLGLMLAVQRFDPARGRAFSTFAWKTIRGTILTLVHNRGEQGRRTVSLSADLLACLPGRDDAPEAPVGDVIGDLLAGLPERSRRILVNRFAYGWTWREVAAAEGMSKQGAQYAASSAIRFLRGRAAG